VTGAAELVPGVHLPELCPVLEVVPLTHRESFYRIALPRPLGHRPGQFVMVSVLGIGEAPISISNGPTDELVLELVIRKAGSLTSVLAGLQPGDEVGIRGPFGSGFDIDELTGQDLLFFCGGLGLVPLRSLIEPVIADKERFGRVTIISGCRIPSEELYRDRLEAWQEVPGVDVIRLVDRTEHQPWKGDVGLVTKPIPDLQFDPDRTFAALCGPPVMYKFVVLGLSGRGLPHDRIFVDLERRMRCGQGRCGHCQINHVYCCQEGPVFRLSDVERLREALR